MTMEINLEDLRAFAHFVYIEGYHCGCSNEAAIKELADYFIKGELDLEPFR